MFHFPTWVGLISVPPDVVVSVGLLPLLTLHKPLMLIAGVVRHKVHDDLEPFLFGLL